jgi:hypothetical protein
MQKAQEHVRQRCSGDKIHQNGNHQIHQNGKFTASVDVQNKISGVKVKHAERRRRCHEIQDYEEDGQGPTSGSSSLRTFSHRTSTSAPFDRGYYR